MHVQLYTHNKHLFHDTNTTALLNKDLRYKTQHPSHFRQHLISILIKSRSARGCLNQFPKQLQNKTIFNEIKLALKLFVP